MSTASNRLQGETGPQAAGPFQLTKQEVHIWQAKLDVDSVVVERRSSYLSADEKQRAGRFVVATAGVRFTVARGILRELLGGYLGRSPGDIRLETGPRGKPAVVAGAGAPDLRFNLSHSHGFALYAFALERELGIDVEKIRPEVVLEGIEKNYLSARELQELRALPDELRPEGFFLCWTRKEAYIKARGEGLHIPLNSFDVSLTPGQPAILNSTDQVRWSIHSLQSEPCFVGALVVEAYGGALQLRERRYSVSDTDYS
jgi:4'-phosphopantetheinyl transferase